MAVRAFFGKDARGKIISSVCHVNRVIFDVTQAVGKEEPFWMWPTVDTGEGKVDPLLDARIVEFLRKQDMEHCFVTPWSFGHESDMEDKLECPCSFAINSREQFIVADGGDRNVNVFDRRGKAMDHFNLPDDVDQDVERRELHDVASDANDNFYVLVEMHETGSEESEIFVYKLNCNTELLHKLSVNVNHTLYSLASFRGRYGVTVDGKGSVLCRIVNVINVYENDGRFVRSFWRKTMRARIGSDMC